VESRCSRKCTEMNFEENAVKAAWLFVGASIALTLVAAHFHIASGDFNKYYLVEEAVKWMREGLLLSLVIAFAYFAWLNKKKSAKNKRRQ